jgi:hypothetical protein
MIYLQVTVVVFVVAVAGFNNPSAHRNNVRHKRYIVVKLLPFL